MYSILTGVVAGIFLVNVKVRFHVRSNASLFHLYELARGLELNVGMAYPNIPRSFRDTNAASPNRSIDPDSKT